MRRTILPEYVTAWKFRREQKRYFHALRERDGEDCRRCRRPMRFDLPDGHDQAAKIERIRAAASGGTGELDNLCLTHVRCNPGMVDHTPEVVERIRRKNEAELFSKSRRARKAARPKAPK